MLGLSENLRGRKEIKGYDKELSGDYQEAVRDCNGLSGISKTYKELKGIMQG